MRLAVATAAAAAPAAAAAAAVAAMAATTSAAADLALLQRTPLVIVLLAVAAYVATAVRAAHEALDEGRVDDPEPVQDADEQPEVVPAMCCEAQSRV